VGRPVFGMYIASGEAPPRPYWTIPDTIERGPGKGHKRLLVYERYLLNLANIRQKIIHKTAV